MEIWKRSFLFHDVILSREWAYVRELEKEKKAYRIESDVLSVGVPASSNVRLQIGRAGADTGLK